MAITFPDRDAATAEYIRIIRDWLTVDQLQSVISGFNDVDDYCDSNQAMFDAIETLVPGFHENMGDYTQEAVDLTVYMWDSAKEKNYE